MVDVRVVGVTMFQTFVTVCMRMRFPLRITGFIMSVLMVFVVNVWMLMEHRLVNVQMLMMFGRVQPYS